MGITAPMPIVLSNLSKKFTSLPFMWTKKKHSSFMENILRNLTRSIVSGRIVFVLIDGQKIECDSGVKGANARIELHSLKPLRRLVTSGYLGLAEGYISGEWTTPSLRDLFDFGAENMTPLDVDLTTNTFVNISNEIIKFFKRNNRKGSRKNISDHYDLGNKFFGEWLDNSMTYSSGIYDANTALGLPEAQEAKYRRIIEKLDIQSHHCVLEIGCGWGGFAEFAAKETGAKISGITISQEQYDFAVGRIAEANLQHCVDIQLKDYRDLTGKFDRVVSIEMLEAVGEKYWPTYFDKVSSCLAHKGEAMIQVITMPDHLFEAYRESIDFIQRYIFPGGMLPSPGKMSQLSKLSDLEMLEPFMFGSSYALTLEAWQKSFQHRWETIQAYGFDDRFKRIWEYYLEYTSAGFRAGAIDVGQFHFRKNSA
jgi:cyclopropane-fatty-acyl-phospholipid synthase